jgi:hypothetical protein
MNTSAAAIEDTINVLMGGLAFSTTRGAAVYTEEGIVERIDGNSGLDRFQPRGGPPAMGEHKPLAFPYAAEDAFGVISEVQHGDGLHYVEV